MHGFGTRRPVAQAPVQAQRHARRRYARQGLAAGFVGGTHQVELAVQVQRLALVDQPPVAFQLHPVQPRRHAAELVLGHRAFVGVHLPAGAEQRDVVGEIAAEGAGLETVDAVLPGDGQVQVAAFFDTHVGVAHLVGAGGDMQAVGVELVEGRRAFGVGQVGAQLPRRRQWVDAAQRRAEGRERARLRRAELGLSSRIAVRGHTRMAETCAQAEADIAQRPFLESEHGELPRRGAGHECLFAQRREVRIFGLQPEDAAQAAAAQRQPGMLGL